MIRTAHLRSYLREEGMPRYESDAVAEDGPVRGDANFLWREIDTDDAFAAEWGGARYVCPRNFRLRKLEGLLAFNNAFPESGLIPHRALMDAAAQLESLRGGSPMMRSYILTSPWHVPIRWFGAFLHEERATYEHAAGLSVRYRALMLDARHRVERGARILADAGFDGSVVGQVRSLGSWLEGFPDDGMLELDYGTVATLFSEGDLVLDESAADVAASLLALEHGDMEAAAEHYATLTRRWGHVQALSFSN